MEPFIMVSIDQLDDLAAERDVRTDRGSLDELACSLITHGLITPPSPSCRARSPIAT